MKQPSRPTLRQLRELYLLVGECCELGADPIAWRQHMTEQAALLVGGQVAILIETAVTGTPFETRGWLKPLLVVDSGWPAASDRKPFEEFVRRGRPEIGPHVSPRMLRPGGRTTVFHSCGQMNRSDWHRTELFAEYVKCAHLDDMIHTHHLSDLGRLRWLHVHRAIKERPFNDRDRHILTLLNVELSCLLGTKLARVGGATVTDLPPRQRDVLIGLMRGDSEKQVAMRLGISCHTVHDHLKLLHQRFGVSSRGELLACCRKFWPVLEGNRQWSCRAGGSDLCEEH